MVTICPPSNFEIISINCTESYIYRKSVKTSHGQFIILPNISYIICIYIYYHILHNIHVYYMMIKKLLARRNLFSCFYFFINPRKRTKPGPLFKF